MDYLYEDTAVHRLVLDGADAVGQSSIRKPARA